MAVSMYRGHYLTETAPGEEFCVPVSVLPGIREQEPAPEPQTLTAVACGCHQEGQTFRCCWGRCGHSWALSHLHLQQDPAGCQSLALGPQHRSTRFAWGTGGHGQPRPSAALQLLQLLHHANLAPYQPCTVPALLPLPGAQPRALLGAAGTSLEGDSAGVSPRVSPALLCSLWPLGLCRGARSR